MKFDRCDIWRKFFFSKLWFSYCMECKFKYLREKLLICHYFSRKSYLHLSKKLDIKHLHKLNFKKKFPKKIFFKIIFSLCMECKFEWKNNFFGKFQNFLDIWRMRLMTFVTVLWMRQLTYKLIYVYEIWLMRHITLATYDIWNKKAFSKKYVIQKYDFLFVWNANLIIYKVNFLFVIILVENCIFIQLKNLI